MQNEDLTYVVQNIMGRLENLERFGVPKFNSTAARDAAFSTNLAPGMAAYIASNDVNEGLYFRTSAGIWRPAAWNEPWGMLGLSSLISSVGSIGSVTQDSGLTLTLTLLANRFYMLSALVRLQQGGAVGDQFVQITDGSNNLLAQSNIGVSGTTSFGTHTPWDVHAFSAGSITIKVRVNSSAGATLVASSTARALLRVDDLGPSGAPS